MDRNALIIDFDDEDPARGGYHPRQSGGWVPRGRGMPQNRGLGRPGVHHRPQRNPHGQGQPQDSMQEEIERLKAQIAVYEGRRSAPGEHAPGGGRQATAMGRGWPKPGRVPTSQIRPGSAPGRGAGGQVRPQRGRFAQQPNFRPRGMPMQGTQRPASLKVSAPARIEQDADDFLQSLGNPTTDVQGPREQGSGSGRHEAPSFGDFGWGGRQQASGNREAPSFGADDQGAMFGNPTFPLPPGFPGGGLGGPPLPMLPMPFDGPFQPPMPFMVGNEAMQMQMRAGSGEFSTPLPHKANSLVQKARATASSVPSKQSTGSRNSKPGSAKPGSAGSGPARQASPKRKKSPKMHKSSKKQKSLPAKEKSPARAASPAKGKSAQPPLPREEPPLPREEPPLPREEPPLTREEPPLTREEPPLPREELPQSQAPRTEAVDFLSLHLEPPPPPPEEHQPPQPPAESAPEEPPAPPPLPPELDSQAMPQRGTQPLPEAPKPTEPAAAATVDKLLAVMEDRVPTASPPIAGAFSSLEALPQRQPQNPGPSRAGPVVLATGVPEGLSELRSVLTEKQSLQLRQMVLERILEEGRGRLNDLATRERYLRDMLGDRAKAAVVQPISIPALINSGEDHQMSEEDVDDFVTTRAEQHRARRQRTQARLIEAGLDADSLALLPTWGGSSGGSPEASEPRSDASMPTPEPEPPAQREKRKREESPLPAASKSNGQMLEDLRKRLLAAQEARHGIQGTEVESQARSKSATPPRAESAATDAKEPAADLLEEPTVPPSSKVAAQRLAELTALSEEKAAARPSRESAAKPAAPSRSELAGRPEVEAAAPQRDESAVPPRGEAAAQAGEKATPEPAVEPAAEQREESGSALRDDAGPPPRDESAGREREEAAVRGGDMSRRGRRERTSEQPKDTPLWRDRGYKESRRGQAGRGRVPPEVSGSPQPLQSRTSKSPIRQRASISPAPRRRRRSGSPADLRRRGDSTPRHQKDRRPESLRHSRDRRADSPAKSQSYRRQERRSTSPPVRRAAVASKADKICGGVLRRLKMPPLATAPKDGLALRLAHALRDTIHSLAQADMLPLKRLKVKDAEAKATVVAVHKTVASVMISSASPSAEQIKLVSSISDNIAGELASKRLRVGDVPPPLQPLRPSPVRQGGQPVAAEPPMETAPTAEAPAEPLGWVGTEAGEAPFAQSGAHLAQQAAQQGRWTPAEPAAIQTPQGNLQPPQGIRAFNADLPFTSSRTFNSVAHDIPGLAPTRLTTPQPGPQGWMAAPVAGLAPSEVTPPQPGPQGWVATPAVLHAGHRAQPGWQNVSPGAPTPLQQPPFFENVLGGVAAAGVQQQPPAAQASVPPVSWATAGVQSTPPYFASAQPVAIPGQGFVGGAAGAQGLPAGSFPAGGAAGNWGQVPADMPGSSHAQGSATGQQGLALQQPLHEGRYAGAAFTGQQLAQQAAGQPPALTPGEAAAAAAVQQTPRAAAAVPSAATSPLAGFAPCVVPALQPPPVAGHPPGPPPEAAAAVQPVSDTPAPNEVEESTPAASAKYAASTATNATSRQALSTAASKEASAAMEEGEISEGPEEEVLGGVFLRPAGSTAAAAQPKPAAINFKLTVTSPEGPGGSASAAASCFGALIGAGVLDVRLLQSKLPTPTESSPGGGPARDTSEPYESPLLWFRSYRLCPTFTSVSGLQLASRSFAHRIRPDWPLCPYELRGSCRDTKCRFQMNVDAALNNMELLQNLQDLARRAGAGNSLPPPNLGGESGLLTKHATALLNGARPAIIMQPPSERSRAAAAARKKPRLSEPEIREASRAGEVPLYTIFGDRRPQLLFKSLILGSVEARQHFEGGALFGLDGGAARADAETPHPKPLATARAATEGRYFSSQDVSAAMEITPADQPDAGELGPTAGDEEGWLHLTVASIQSDTSGTYVNALKLLAKGLTMYRSSPLLWPLYVHLFDHHSKHTSEELAAIMLAALRFQPRCYQLWIVCLSKLKTAEERVRHLQRALLVFSESRQDESAEDAESRTACLLDLALRLLHLFNISQTGQDWLAGLARDASASETLAPLDLEEAGAMDDKQLSAAAIQALRLGLRRWPQRTLVLWQAAAYSAAFGELPAEIVHRLGHAQHVAPLHISAAPPAAANKRVHTVLSHAAGASIACLNFRAAAKVPGRGFSSAEDAHAVACFALTLARWHSTAKAPAVVTTATTDAFGTLHPLLLAACRAHLFLQRVPGSTAATQANEAGTYCSQLLQLAVLQSSIPGAVSPKQPTPASTGKSPLPRKSPLEPPAAYNKIVNKHPWVKELYNQHSRDKRAFQQRYQELTRAQKGAFKAFCHEVKAYKAASKAGGSEDLAGSQRGALLTEAEAALKWLERTLSQLPGGLVETESGRPRLPQAAVGALSVAIHMRSKDSERALAVLAASLPLPQPSKSDRTPPAASEDLRSQRQSERDSSANQGRSRSPGRRRSWGSSPHASSASGRNRGPAASPAHPATTEAPAELWEEDGPMSSSKLARERFAALLAAPTPKEAPLNVEEGELPEEGEQVPGGRQAALQWHPWEKTATALNLALFEVLSGEPSAALKAFQAALRLSDGPAKECVWADFLGFAGAVLLGNPSAGPVAPASAQGTPLAGGPNRVSRGQLMLQIVEQFLSDRQSVYRLVPLAPPCLMDRTLQKKLGPPPAAATDTAAATLLQLLLKLSKHELARVTEAATRHWPTAGGTAVVAVEAFAAGAKEEQWASWAAPLAASMLGTAYPVPAPNLWLKAISLMQPHFPAAAREVADLAAARWPHSQALGKKQRELVTAGGESAGAGRDRNA